MVIEVDDKRTFVPEWNGNRDLADGQIKIAHRFLKPGERKKYMYSKPLKINAEGKIDGVEYVQDERGVCEALILSIEGLELKTGDKTVKVTTGAELYNTPGVPQALVAEIEMYMIGATPEVDRDFLSGR